MLATAELIHEIAQAGQMESMMPRWLEFPLYHSAVGGREFSRLPKITKQDMRRDFPNNFLRAGQNLQSLLDNQEVELEHTSGTSEERTAVLFGRGWWSAQEARVLRLNPFVASVLDAHPDARRATLTPPVCNGLICFSNWTSRSARIVDSTLFVNQARIPFLLPEAELARMAEEIFHWSPQFLDLDPVHGSWFALYCERHRIQFPSVKFILCSYEFVSVVHRRVLERVFGVPVFNLYGSTETGHLLMENERGEMKPQFDLAFYEVEDPDARGIGNLVVTTLTNDYMPLVRYRIGDLVERCELPYSTTYHVHGRIRDALVRGDGSRVSTLEVDECFKDMGGMVHYQLRQSSDGSCTLKFAPESGGPSAEDLERLKVRLQTLLLSSKPVIVEAVPMLPPTTSGKFRLTQGA